MLLSGPREMKCKDAFLALDMIVFGWEVRIPFFWRDRLESRSFHLQYQQLCQKEIQCGLSTNPPETARSQCQLCNHLVCGSRFPCRRGLQEEVWTRRAARSWIIRHCHSPSSRGCHSLQPSIGVPLFVTGTLCFVGKERWITRGCIIYE